MSITSFINELCRVFKTSSDNYVPPKPKSSPFVNRLEQEFKGQPQYHRHDKPVRFVFAVKRSSNVSFFNTSPDDCIFDGAYTRKDLEERLADYRIIGLTEHMTLKTRESFDKQLFDMGFPMQYKKDQIPPRSAVSSDQLHKPQIAFSHSSDPDQVKKFNDDLEKSGIRGVVNGGRADYTIS